MENHDNSDIALGPRPDAPFGDSFPLTEQEQPGQRTRIYTPGELAALPPADLLAHAAYLQDMCGQFESENRFLVWEFREAQNNVVYFSRAAKLAHRLNACDLDTVAALAVNEIPEYFGCRFASLFFYDPGAQLLKLHSATAMPSRVPPLHRVNDADHILVKLFFHRSEPFLVEYAADSGEFYSEDERLNAVVPKEWHEALGDKALVFPLHVNRPDAQEPLVLGGLVIGDARTELQVGDAEIAIVFADLLSSSLYNAKLVEELNELTIIEPLTQIYNRRHLMSQLVSAMAQAKRHGHGLSVAMLDIDEFKRFNDTYGHLCGDDVLRAIAAVIKDSVRQNVDTPARYGGEEFMIVMPFTSLAEAASVAERIRKKVGELVFTFEGRRLSIACSLGVAKYDGRETLEQLIERADSALYSAKALGRNRVFLDSRDENGPR